MTDKNSVHTQNKIPWSIRGISPNAKSFASVQARKAGINVGEWVELAILEKAKNDRSGGRSVAVKEQKPVDATQVNGLLDMMQKLTASGVEIPASLSRKTSSLLSKVATDIKRGHF
ncbi:hypothetical protein [Gluconacetobacter asukensis]|uniref:Uncharacterized protein n=1 Tax=Gluconacetobacter asukensis TaxID=1017181 RepID=A0A7W4J433_9PROT|nr:hypothetical protein [Gluconacetobacter asukensis]MBB2174068.1 hypothetical protein [Gluconacetobacter asukensis]